MRGSAISARGWSRWLGGGAAASVLALAAAGCLEFQQKPFLLAAEEHYVRVGRGRIYVEERGQGPAVLLIHGYGSASDAWARVIPALAREHRVLAVDLPGFGRSEKYPGDYSPEALAHKLFALLDAKGVDHVHVAGHSWGASIALAMALQRPRRVRSLTLLGAWVFEEQLPAFIRWARAPGVGEALYALFYDQRVDDRMALGFYDPEPFVQPAVIDRVKRALGRPGAKAAALAAARGQRYADMQRRYPTITQPALLIWGRQDRVSLVRHGYRLDALLPRSRFALVEHCGHIPQLERPNKVLQRLVPFLRAQVGTAPAAAPASKPGADPAGAPGAPRGAASAGSAAEEPEDAGRGSDRPEDTR